MHETGEPKQRIAIYGGSFNPPHMGHLITIFSVLEFGLVDSVWIMPCYRHAFGKSSAPFETRVLWCKKLIRSFSDHVKVCTIEKEIGKTSRTIDTLDVLQNRYPNNEFHLILGSDIRAETHKWKSFDLLEQRYPLLWIGRTNHDPHPDDVMLLPDYSSLRIRKACRAGQSIEKMVPRSILSDVVDFDWSRKNAGSY